MPFKLNAPLLLASKSPQRKQLLESIGIMPDVTQSADIDETPLKGEKLEEYVVRVSLDKAQALQPQFSDHIILAGDTMVAAGKTFIPKADTKEEAFKLIKKMSGRKNKISSGIAILLPNGKSLEKSVTSICEMSVIPDQMIEYYLDHYEQDWQERSGCFSVNGFMQLFIKQIKGSYANIIGLPTREAYNMLLGSGALTLKN